MMLSVLHSINTQQKMEERILENVSGINLFCAVSLTRDSSVTTITSYAAKQLVTENKYVKKFTTLAVIYISIQIRSCLWSIYFVPIKN